MWTKMMAERLDKQSFVQESLRLPLPFILASFSHESAVRLALVDAVDSLFSVLCSCCARCLQILIEFDLFWSSVFVVAFASTSTTACMV
jgi:hypothetical protein